MSQLLQWDEDLFLFLNNLGCRQYDYLWTLISAKFFWIPLYLLLLYLLIKTYPRKVLIWALICIALVFFATDFMVSQVYRPVFERFRPCHVPELQDKIRLVKEGCGGQYGFFSAHASNSFGLATIVGNMLKKKYPWALKLLIAWAILVSYSRIYLGVHYPLDILMGALYGSIMGFTFYRLFQKLRPKFYN